MKKNKKKSRIALGIGVAAVAAAGNYLCDYAIKRPNGKEKDKPETREAYIKRAELRRINNQNLFDRNPEDLELMSVDSLKMKAWFFNAKRKTKRFVICVHGHKANGPDEFSHIVPFYLDTLKYNVLLPDLTAHGRSEGKYIGFGSFDSKNILLWVDYLINTYGDDIEIILHGISMGAATVLNCNEMSPPDQVKLIIEDCGYANTVEQLNNALKNMIKFECKPLVSIASIFAKMKAGYFFSESDPIGNMDKAKNPILFIHGMEDTYVPFEYGQKLYDACKVEKDYLWVPDTPHAFSYYNAKEEYEAKITDFITKQLGSLN